VSVRSSHIAPRWLSRDPLGEYAGVNLYGYCGDDPGNTFDPFGMACGGSGGGGASWGDIAGMFAQWYSGTAPYSQTFGPETPQTHDMMGAPGVQNALAYFNAKNRGRGPGQQLSVTNYRAGFGILGAIAAGNNPTQQFVGDYRLDLYPNKDGSITIYATNTTSLSSWLYHLYPSALNLPNGFPEGNATQVYYWTVPNGGSGGGIPGGSCH